MARKQINTRRLHNMKDDQRITRDQAADIMGCAAATIAAHNYAGILPYAPTRPITIMVSDLKQYAKFILNWSRKNLHLTMRIKPEDCPTYSRLDGVQSLTFAPPDVVLNKLIKTTNDLFVRYRADEKKGR